MAHKDKRFYVYVHRRKTGPRKGEVFYVGKGSGRRLRRTNRTHNIHWMRTVNLYGFVPEIVMHFNNEACAFSFERAVIAHYGRENLCNFTDGGEGVSGYKHTEERRKAISIESTGRLHTDEAKEKIAASKRGKPRSEETKMKLSMYNKKPIYTECGLSFESGTDAVDWLKENGHDKAGLGNVSNCCLGTAKSAYGYVWRYYD